MGLKVMTVRRLNPAPDLEPHLEFPTHNVVQGMIEMIHEAPYISCFQSFEFQRANAISLPKPFMRNDSPPVFHPWHAWGWFW